MSLWSKDSMRDVLKNLIDGMSEAWVKVGKYWRVPCKSAITQARSAIRGKGNESIISPVSTTNSNDRNIGSVFNGLRIVVIDGTCFDVADTDENARIFGRPSSRPGTQAAFPARQVSNISRSTEHT